MVVLKFSSNAQNFVFSSATLFIVFCLFLKLTSVYTITTTNYVSVLKRETSLALTKSQDEEMINGQSYGFFLEDCLPFYEVTSAIKNLFEEFNVTGYLHIIQCNNPISFFENLSAKKLLIGGGNVIIASSPSLFRFLTKENVAGSSFFKIDVINLNDHLLLYQKSVTPNYAEELLSDIFTQWGWRNIHCYVDENYADDFLSNVEKLNDFGESVLQVNQLSLVENISPYVFVDGLITERPTGIRSIVLMANISTTLQVLQWAFPTELMSGRQQWIIFGTEDLEHFYNAIQLQSDSQIYIVRHKNNYKDLKHLVLEYLKLKPPFDAYSTNSSLLYSMDTLDGKVAWKNVMASVMNLEIRKLSLASDSNITSSEVAVWTPESGLVKIPEPPFPNYNMRSLLVVTMESPPYIIIHSNNGDRSNLSYSGYMVDVIEVVAKVLNFSIQYVEVENSLISQVTNLSVNGVVETLARKEADVGLLDMAITSSRMQEVDFAEVALDVQATAGLYRRQGSEGDGMDKFGVYLEPFHYHVWIASIITVILLVASLYVSLQLTQRFSDMIGIDWENADLNVSRSILLGFQAVAQQGSELDFGNPSARIFFVILWIFALIAYSSYSATLMSYLTFSRIPQPFTSLSTLAKNKEYGIGVLVGSSQLELFRESRSPVYQAIWKRILTDKRSMTLQTMEQAFKKSAKDKFVYLSDDKIMKYWTRNTCDLVVSEPLTGSHLVTLTFQKSSPHRKAISRVLRMMNDGGLLYRLREKWWGTGLICKTESQAFLSLSLMNVATGFLLLAGGIVGGTLGLLLEWCIFRGRKPQKRKMIQVTQLPKDVSPKQLNDGRILKLAFLPDYDSYADPNLDSQKRVVLKSSPISFKPHVF
ncbi:hypothetical protein CHUAL_014201 [Chamberlinius hualienensis]